MRVIISITVFLLCVTSISGQTKTCNIPTYKNGDTSFWYKFKNENSNKIRLTSLINSTDSMHFRFWTETQVIDIWTNDFTNFNGQLINFTTSVKSKKSDALFYSEIVALNQSKTDSIYKAFDENSIFKIPDQENIPGWKSGLDGSIYFIEYSSKREYSFKSYWTPTSFTEIKEAVTIQSLITYLFRNLALESSWYSFVKTLPKSCYNAGGISMICPKLSKRAIKRIYYNN